MRLRSALLVPLLLAAAPALAADRIEVTRFHTPETLARLGPGAVEVVAAPGTDGASLETRAWLDAVARELAGKGLAGGSERALRVAEVRLTRDTVEGAAAARPRSSVGIGVGSGGGWHRGGGTSVGLGIGLGFPLGKSADREQVDSELEVTIRDKTTGASLWEGRSTLRTARRKADSPETAQRLAHALFTGFPGRSGETIEVK